MFALGGLRHHPGRSRTHRRHPHHPPISSSIKAAWNSVWKRIATSPSTIWPRAH